jgi:hypothetical protein
LDVHDSAYIEHIFYGAVMLVRSNFVAWLSECSGESHIHSYHFLIAEEEYGNYI